MKTTSIILLSILAIAVVGGAYFLINQNEEKPIVYGTDTTYYTDIIKKTVATGSVVPRKEVEVKPQVSGLISKLHVEAGDMVKVGDLIATVRIIPDMVNLNNAENRLQRAKIAMKNSKRDFDRNEQLLKDGVIAAATFQEVELSYLNAQQELQGAQDNLDLIRRGSTKRSGKTANTNIRATISGMVLDVPIEEGNSVIEANTFNDGTTIAIVANMDEMIFEGKVDEAEVGKIKEGMPLLLTIGAIEGVEFPAILEHISPKGLEENGAIQFEIRAAIELREDQFIRAGYSANADIVLDRRDSVLAIKEAVLQFKGEKSFVEVERSSQVFDTLYVETGLADGINIELLSKIDESLKIKNPNLIIGQD
ncbi:MAG: efflux RND transporter periplasmic adaptor subunit [Bacteroidota bacterium]